MCGRYAIFSDPDAIRELFGYAEQPNFPPRYNIVPTQPVPIVRLVEGVRHFALVRWGLIPSWVKDPRGLALLINARAESVNDKPAFRVAMRRRRCLFPADGFYEWKGKRPYFVRLKSGGPMVFAGLWETWTGPDGEELESAAIVTTRANPACAAIHPRMPAIVPPEAFAHWLDCEKVDARAAAALLTPAPNDLLEAYEVSPAVNCVANDSPALLEPLRAHTALRAPQAKATGGRPAAKSRLKKNDGQASLF